MKKKIFEKKLKKIYLDMPISQKINSLNNTIIIIIIILLGLVSTYVSSNVLISGRKKSSIQNLELVSKSLDNLISNTEKSANILIPYPEVQKNISVLKFENEMDKIAKEKFLQTIVDNITSYGDEIATSVIIGLNGLEVVSGRVDEKNFKETLKQEKIIEYRKILKKQNSKWFDLHKYNYSESRKNENKISYKKNILNGETGEKKGVLVLNINEEVIAETYSSIDYGDKGKVLIVNSQGTIVSSEIKEEIYNNLSGEDYIKWSLKNNMSGKIFNFQGEKHLVVAVKYKKLDWTIVGVISLNEFLIEGKLIIILILIAGIILGLIAISIVRITSKTISKPIIELCNEMEKLGKGNFEIEIKELGNDEVGQLSKTFNVMTREIEELLKINFEQNKKQREYEFIALQAQIKPHFLYNTLESICSLILMEQKDEAYKMTNALSNYYRTSLSKGKRIISVEEEILNIVSYLTIQKIRYGDKFDYEIDIEEEIKKKLIIKLSIQPLVENSIYHGIKLKEGKGRIIIQGKIVEGKVCISVIDDGVGMKRKKIEHILENSIIDEGNTSFGVKSVDERIKLVFGNEYGLEIESEIGLGTKVEIHLPIKSDKENDIYD